MSRTSVRVAAIALLSLLGASAQAQVIDFNEFTKTTAGADKTGQDNFASISSGGFSFTNDCSTPSACLAVWDSDSIWQMDAGGAAIFNNYGYTTTTLTREGGGAFDLRSIDLGDVYNAGLTSTLEFTFHYLAGGSSFAQVVLDTLPGSQTAWFNQAGLSSVSWRSSISSTRGWAQFDNVNVSPVPEPATPALMLTGLALVGLLARRRRTSR